MALTFGPDDYQLSLTHLDGVSLRPAVVTLGLNSPTPMTLAKVEGIITAWSSPGPLAEMNAEWRLSSTTVANGTGALFTLTTVVGALGGGSPAPPNCTFLVKKVTGVGGRKNRGRMYLPGVGESDVDGIGGVLAAKVTGLNIAFTSFMTALAALDISPCILHTEALPSTGILSFQTENLIATQRRRLRG